MIPLEYGYQKAYDRNERDSVVVGIVKKYKLLDFSIMLVFWSLVSLVRNGVVIGNKPYLFSHRMTVNVAIHF